MKLQVVNSDFGVSIVNADSDLNQWQIEYRFADNEKSAMIGIMLVMDGQIVSLSRKHKIDATEWDVKSIICELVDSIIEKSDVEYWDENERLIDGIRDAADKYIEFMFDGNRLGLDEIEPSYLT